MERGGRKSLKKRLLSALGKLREAKVLVLGDAMLDIYLYGDVERVSPEAPVPVVKLRERKEMPGGAANAALNLSSTGALAYLIGVVGRDEDGRKLKEILREKIGYKLVVEEGRVTTTKTRVVARSQHIVRFDNETVTRIDKITETEIILHLKEIASKFNTILISDYGKGVITARIFKTVSRIFKKIIVDPYTGHMRLYKGISAILPNEREAEVITGIKLKNDDAVYKAAQTIMERCKAQLVVIKRGEKGMYVVDARNKRVFDIPALKREVYDVAGAGDTVAAVFSAGLDVGIELEVISYLATIFASIVVTKTGTAVASPEEVEREIENLVSD